MLSLTTILIQVSDGTLTPAEAEPLVRQATVDRNAFAAAALTGFIAQGANFGSNGVLATRCFDQADACVAAAGAAP